MSFTDLSLVGFLKTKMNWHQGRQKVLAENVANADTPGYRARELKPMTFERQLAAAGLPNVAASRTNTAHFAAVLPGMTTGFNTEKSEGWEITPEGNGVVLEEQMMKVSANQFDFQLASTLYTRSLGLLRTAAGRNS